MDDDDEDWGKMEVMMKVLVMEIFVVVVEFFVVVEG
jgi:hypothetical protein